MAYFDFENGVTPLNDTNLNAMQDSIEADITQKKQDVINYVDNLGTFSTTESVVGTWYNGKPIYRKIINVGTMQGTTQLRVETNISDLDEAITIKGLAQLESNKYRMNLPSNGDVVSSVICRFNLHSSGALYIERTNNTFYNTIVILEYTKTTD